MSRSVLENVKRWTERIGVSAEEVRRTFDATTFSFVPIS
jgi:hypothetical protein